MKVFQLSNRKLIRLKEKKLDFEVDIQRIVESNLETIFGLKLVRHEFTVQNFRIDTLAYDEQSKSFVIIEYKKDRNFSVIDQGATYLSIMFNNKSHFILEYNEKMGTNLKKQSVDWSQTRVIFIAEGFGHYQVGATGFKDLPIELWQVKILEKNVFILNQIESSTRLNASIKSFRKGVRTFDKVSREVKIYSLDDHFKKTWVKSRNLFEKLKEQLMQNYPNTTEKITKLYVAYLDDSLNKSFLEIVAQKQGIKVYLRPFVKQLKSPLKLNDCSKISHWTNGNTYFQISKTEDVPYAIELIKQAYNLLQKETK